MLHDQGNYRPGHIVKVRLDDSRGAGKIRWMLVLSDLQSEPNHPFFLCVAISTTFPHPPPANSFPPPWHPSGSASTGLRKRSAAILDWVRKIPPDAIIQKDGYVTNAMLRPIYKSLESFEDTVQ